MDDDKPADAKCTKDEGNDFWDPTTITKVATLDIHQRGVTIDVVDRIKYLRVMLNQHLTFGEQVQYIKRK